MPMLVILLVTSAGFASAFAFMGALSGTLPPWTLAALRAALSLPLFVIAAGLLGPQRLPRRHDLVTALVGGLLIVVIPFVTMAAALAHIPSSMGSMLHASMPLITLAAAAMVLPGESATFEQGARMGVGLLGVVLILIPALFGIGFGEAGWGTLLALCSPASYAAGNLWFRSRRPMAPVMLAAGMFLFATLILWPMALLIDGPVSLGDATGGLMLLLGLVVVATVLPILLNHGLVQIAGAHRAVLVSYLMPIFALVFGIVFLGEGVSLLGLVGLALIVGASTARLPGSRAEIEAAVVRVRARITGAGRDAVPQEAAQAKRLMRFPERLAPTVVGEASVILPRPEPLEPPVRKRAAVPHAPASGAPPVQKREARQPEKQRPEGGDAGDEALREERREARRAARRAERQAERRAARRDGR